MPTVLGDLWADYGYPALAAAGALLLLVVILLRRRRPPPVKPLREKVADLTEQDDKAPEPDIERVLLWLPGEAKHGERRRVPRRRGRPVSIRVSRLPDADPKLAEEGLVLDRSSQGLCFAAHHAFEPGTLLYVRARRAPTGSPWVAVTVRRCHGRGDHSLIGCEFLEPPPVNVLLLFG